MTGNSGPAHLSRRGLLLGAGAAAAAAAVGSRPAQAAARKRVLQFVAHQDDDLLFMNPDLVRDIRAGAVVRTVFLTAGDNGEGSEYYLSREAGARAAYSRMANFSGAWTFRDAGIRNHPARLASLTGRLSHVSLRLPDGNIDGSGTSANPGLSLERLWRQEIDRLPTVDGTSTYTRAELIDVLYRLMLSFAPTEVRGQDHAGSRADGHDHSDHYATGYFTKAAVDRCANAPALHAYWGYETAIRPENVTGADLAAKKDAFYAYARHDHNVCADDGSCVGSPYELWFARQYRL